MEDKTRSVLHITKSFATSIASSEVFDTTPNTIGTYTLQFFSSVGTFSLYSIQLWVYVNIRTVYTSIRIPSGPYIYGKRDGVRTPCCTLCVHLLSFLLLFFDPSLLLSSFWIISRGHRVRRPPPPPQYVPSFLSRIGCSIPTARDFHRMNVANFRRRAFRWNQLLCKKQSPVYPTYECVHSVRIEPTQLILVGTRTTAFCCRCCCLGALA